MQTKKRILATILVFSLLGITAARAEMVTIWGQDFENGLDPNWLVDGDGFSVIESSLALEGDGYLNVVGPSSEGGSSISWEVELAGHESPLFWGWAKVHGSIETGDSFAVQYRFDHLDAWTDLTLIAGPQPVNDWFAVAGSLPDPTEGDSTVELRLWANFNSATDRVLADSFMVRGIVPEPATAALLTIAAGALTRRRRWTNRGSIGLPRR